MKFTEMSKLWLTLAELNIDMTVAPLFNGYQIRGDGWDVICHEYSYGFSKGLLEIYGNDFDDAIGYLTADECYDIIAKIEGI